MQHLFTFGDLVLDVVATARTSLEPDTDTPGEVRSAPGGSAANFAVWTRRLGDPVCFATRVGDDLLGRALVADMRDEGVEVHATRDPVNPTAVLVLFSDGVQRHMMVPSGASHFLEPSDLPEERLRSAGWLHLTGYAYFWEATRRALDRALTVAREAGVPISFDPSSAGFIRRHGLDLPEGIKVLMPNRDEARALIDRLEPVPRGWYAGAVGAVLPGGDLQLWLTIRSLALQGGTALVRTGAGLVPGSDPAAEWQECMAKAQRALAAVGAALPPPEEVMRDHDAIRT